MSITDAHGFAEEIRLRGRKSGALMSVAADAARGPHGGQGDIPALLDSDAVKQKNQCSMLPVIFRGRGKKNRREGQ